VPAGRRPPKSVLPLEQGFSGGGQEALGRRYRARSERGRGAQLAAGERAAQGGLGRGTAEGPAVEKKRARGWGGRHMRYPASEKLEIIRTVEDSALGMRRTLRQIGIPRSTFYRWYDRYLTDGLDGLEDR